MTDGETSPGAGGDDDADGLPPLIGLGAWRSEDWTPAAVDHAREGEFLDQYVEQAWRIHDERQLLFLRLFGEYVNALEILGGWGWATRHRKEFKLLLDAFLSYAPGDVTSFYETVSADGGDLPPCSR